MTNKRLLRLLKTQKLAQANIVFAPANFLNATHDNLLDICNGCGAEGAWFRPPNKMYGTNIEAACHIHDWMYEGGFTSEDKDEADRVFLNNMFRIIDQDSYKWYKPTFLQRRRALKYFEAVKYGGGAAFWKHKN